MCVHQNQEKTTYERKSDDRENQSSEGSFLSFQTGSTSEEESPKTDLLNKQKTKKISLPSPPPSAKRKELQNEKFKDIQKRKKRKLLQKNEDKKLVSEENNKHKIMKKKNEEKVSVPVDDIPTSVCEKCQFYQHHCFFSGNFW